jgi:DUF438 domain-containing protein
MSENLNKVFDWAENVSFAVTVCDSKGYVVYANAKSKLTFAKNGDIIGLNLKSCHPAHAWNKIVEMLETGESNSYTISKNGVKKIIHQTPWYDSGNVGGKPSGLVEISIVIPEEMPHFIRK